MNAKNQTKFTFLMFFAMTLWGLAWTNGKVVNEYTSVPILIFWRFIIGSLTMLPILKFLKVKILPGRDGLRYIVLGGFFMIGYNVFFFLGTRLGLAGAGGILVTTMNPIFTFVYSALLFRQTVLRKDLMGLVLGFIGGSIMLHIWSMSLSDIMQSGNAYFIIASSTWAFVTIVSSRSKNVIHPLTFSLWTYFISAVIISPFAISGSLFEIFTFDLRFWVHFISISVGSMAIGTSIFFIGASHLGSGKASAFIFTVPVTAMGFSMLILNEHLTVNIIFGSLFAMTAVYLITIKKRQSK